MHYTILGLSHLLMNIDHNTLSFNFNFISVFYFKIIFNIPDYLRYKW